MDSLEQNARATCAGCGRRIYQMPAGRGTPSEWRHDSSAHAISWSPERHLASPTFVYEHQHKYAKTKTKDLVACEIAGCDVTMLVYRHVPIEKVYATDRERREAESRKRGTQRSKQLLVQPEDESVPF